MGFYDIAQLRLDGAGHGVAFPVAFEDTHVNLKNEYATWQGVRRCGMAKALSQLGLPLTGTHHRGIHDARNIVLIGRQLLPYLASP